MRRSRLDKCLFALALGCCCLAAIPARLRSCAASNSPVAQSRLRFGQHLALSDFDGDGLVDHALLRRAGAVDSIEIHLSNPCSVTTLSFACGMSPFGSLYAEDIDNDGDYDLVWTDLLHPDEVVVWINDGLGRFERGSGIAYAGRFVLGRAVVRDQDRGLEDGAICSARRQAGDRVQATTYLETVSDLAGRGRRKALAGLQGAGRLPWNRGPPLA